MLMISEKTWPFSESDKKIQKTWGLRDLGPGPPRRKEMVQNTYLHMRLGLGHGLAEGKDT